MIIKPSNMSRRGFLRNVLGVTAVIVLPARPRILITRNGYGGLYFPAGDTRGLHGITFNRDDIWTGVKQAGEAAGLWGLNSEADEKRFMDIRNHFFLDYFRKTNPDKAFALC